MAKSDPSDPSFRPPPTTSNKPRRRDRILNWTNATFGSRSSRQDASSSSTVAVASAPPPADIATTPHSDDSRSANSPFKSTTIATPPSSNSPVPLKGLDKASGSTPKTGSKQTASPINQQAELNPTIFPENISRTVSISLPDFGQRIDSTAQLVHCAHLLQVMESPSFSSCSPPSPESIKSIDGRPLRMKDLDWIRQVQEYKVVEKNRIQQLVVSTVSEFISSPIKDSEAIREIVLVGPVLERVHFRLLLTCFLSSFDSASMLEVEKLQGVVQLVQDAPPGCLEVDDLIRILEIIRERLESTSSQSDNFLFHLTLAVSRVLNCMADMKVKDLDRVEQHDPLRTALAGLKSDSNPFLRYQAIYAAQALWNVPDNETPVECFFRHFINVTGGLIKLSAVMQLDFNSLAGGAKDIQKSIADMYEFVKSGVEDIPALMEDGKELGGCLRAMVGSGRIHPWYMSLRGAEDLVRTGRLADLRVWAWEAPSQGSYLFQWGICQLLGEIAVDPSWGMNSQSQSILFLCEIFKISVHRNVRRWILTILDYISKLSTLDTSTSDHEEEAIKVTAAIARDDLRSNEYEPFSFPYLLGRRLLLPTASSIIQKVNKTVALEPALLKIQIAVSNRGPEFYAQLMAKAGLQDSGDSLKLLEERVLTFLGGKRQIMLILGDSGAGKSTFNRHLERKLWSEYHPGGPIPLFVDLRRMENLSDSEVKKKLRIDDLKDDQIQELKEYRKVIFICDGYDECRQWVNLHSRFRDEGWKSFQIVVTCRSQQLTPNSNYRNYFVPRTEANLTESQASALYEEAVIVPFGENQIKACIEQFRGTEEASKEVFKEGAIWSTEEYINQLANLLELVKNPFMLKLALVTLPNMVGNDMGTSRRKMTRFCLYEEFTDQHFKKELRRLTDQRPKMKWDEEKAFELIENGFVLHGIYFSMRLARSIFMEQDGRNSVEYSTMDNRGWKAQFFGLKTGAGTKLLRQSSQLVTCTIQESNSSGKGAAVASQTTVYSFSHRSILEFLYACCLCDYMQDSRIEEDFSGGAQYPTLSSCLESTDNPSLLAGHPLNQRSIVSEHSVVHFLAERAINKSEFKDQLQTIIELSRTDETIAVAAANAITILVLAGVQFNGMDLRGIQIPGADLSGGHFDSAQLEYADLTDVNLSRAWLRQADFGHARMSGVQFGEKPSIIFPGLTSMALSPNGAFLALGFESGEVRVLNTKDWSTRNTLQGHTYRVLHLAFSSSGLQIASGSMDTTIRIWEWQQESAPSRILRGHSSEVNAVAFSPDGHWLSSASDDMTVRVWDLDLNSVMCTFEGHEDEAWCTAWSLDGQQVASGGKDGAVNLWQTAFGEFERQLWRGREPVCSLVYAPDGKRLVAAVGNDILIWDLLAGGDPTVLEGHTGDVRAVSFSRNEQWIASVSLDKSVGIWNGRTGAPVRKLYGSDPGYVLAVAFWNDQEIISLDWRGMLRFWALGSGAARADMLGIVTGPMAEGHRDLVETVAYSPDGKKVLTGGPDRCIREWNAETGETKIVTTTQTDILHIAFSPENRQVAVVALDDIPILFEQVDDSDDIWVTGYLGAYSAVIVAYSPCGRWVVSGDADGALVLLDRLETDAEEQLLVGHRNWILGIEFSPCEKLFVSWSKDQSIRVWESETGVCIDVIDFFIESLSFSPCGTMVAWSVSVERDEDGLDASDVLPEIHLTDLRWQRDIHVLKGHKNLVDSIAWTSGWIVSGSNDRTVRLWKELRDNETGSSTWTCAAILDDLAVGTVAWNPVAWPLEFAIGSRDSSVSVWTVTTSGGEKKMMSEDDSEETTIQLKWGSIDRLETRGARFTNAVGLDSMQKELLRQHGSIDDAASDDDAEEDEDEDESLVRRVRVADLADTVPYKEMREQ
ncbi:hypothetical protein EMPS_05629 [Entomortierella parvispora]|uniref:WD40 repeat-like protein n=1 Tax=Entomortierella parvispora TaxID=205924 RepID=A0A9P3LWH8_9FUNG|nr:hypothetical protein EMPS_05629 [Entomortierella parvispora]